MPRTPRLLLLLFTIETSATAAAEAAERPNVLLIIADDLNDFVGPLGGHPQARTPRLDRLAARGVVFTNAHCAATVCQPSRAALFGGRQPFHTGVYQNGQQIRRLQPDLVLMQQHFQNGGYLTFGTGKLLHHRTPDLYDESFFPHQRWSPFTPEHVRYAPSELPTKGTRPRHAFEFGPLREQITLPLNGMPSDRSPNDPKGESFDWGPVDVLDDAMGDGQIADWAATRLSTAHEKPFFMAVGFYRPHIPLFAPRRYFDLYPVDRILLPRVLVADLEDLSGVGRRWALEPVTAGRHSTVIEHRQWKAAVAAYLACVSFVDAQVGRLLDALGRGPNAANTIVVFMSDHGWHLGEKQHWGKWTGWERATRVPLIFAPVRLPAQASESLAEKKPESRRCAEPVSLIDLYPTLVEACGLPQPAGLDGRSLLPLVHEPDVRTGRAVVTTFDEGNFAVRDRRWRYLRYRDGSQELYDHQSDPNEWHNLADDPARELEIERLGAHLPTAAFSVNMAE